MGGEICSSRSGVGQFVLSVAHLDGHVLQKSNSRDGVI